MREKILILPFIAAAISSAAFADTPEMVHAFMVQWDLNHDGKISLAEFETQSAKTPEPARSTLTPALIRDTFEHYDLNGDGFITEAEMQEFNRRANAEAAAMRKN
jgi:Ca2+-binding EF-hand superfamily protein